MGKEIKVGVSIFPPLVFKRDRYIGFEIELWEKVASTLGFTSSYIEYPHVKDILGGLAEQKIEVGMAGISMTAEREQHFDFSHTTLDSGLQIMVPNQKKLSVHNMLRSVVTPDVGRIVLVLFGFVILAANLIWLAERNGGGVLSGSYSHSILNSIAWAAYAVVTVGYSVAPVTVAGSVIGILALLCGLVIISLFIAQISSALTLTRLRSNISDLKDLRGRKVATVADTTGVDILKKYVANVIAVPKIHDAFSQLEQGSVDAVVFDAPVLLDYASYEGRGKVTVVGGLFGKQEYAFALPQGSLLVEKVNQILLDLRQSGEYAALYKKWFDEEY